MQPLRPGDPARVPGHRLVGRLGEGGQGAVFLGEAEDGTRVAVKLLHESLIDDPRARKRFVREVAAAQRVARFCTAQVLATGLAGERPYIVSEYIPGPTLEAAVRQDGPRTGGALDRLAVNSATALAAIHHAGVLHRDLKPANILLGPDGPAVIDFGIARALDHAGRHTRAIGTPAYMAPELVEESEVGPAADVFSWGVSMVYAATGRPAFTAGSLAGLFHRIVNGEPDLTGMAGRLREIVALCLAKRPEERPSAAELVRLLSDPSAPVAAATAPRPPSRRPAVALSAAAGAGAVVLVAALVLALGDGDGEPSGPVVAAVPSSGPPTAPGTADAARPSAGSPPRSGPAPKNMLASGGFESGRLAPWGGHDAVVVRGNARSGAHAVRLDATRGQDANVDVKVTGLRPDTAYTLVGWARSGGGSVFIGAKDYGAEKYVRTTAPGYTRLAATFVTGPEATSAVVFCWKQDPGPGTCDDLAFYQGEDPG